MVVVISVLTSVQESPLVETPGRTTERQIRLTECEKYNGTYDSSGSADACRTGSHVYYWVADTFSPQEEEAVVKGCKITYDTQGTKWIWRCKKTPVI